MKYGYRLVVISLCLAFAIQSVASERSPVESLPGMAKLPSSPLQERSPETMAPSARSDWSPLRLGGLDDSSSLDAKSRNDLMRERQERARAKFTPNSPSAPSKPPYDGPANVLSGAKGIIQGDTYDDPFVIASLPFSETGTTAGFNDDYDNTCPWSAPGSPDVVYRYVAPEAQVIRVDLCDSDYDTKVYIAESSDPFNYLACNDDWCGVDGFRSMIESFPMWAGMEIFIIVDGYGGAFGDYELQIRAYDGDDETDPIRISSLPFVAEMTTDGKTDDYDEACPDGSNSPDVVFIYTPMFDQSITIDLCNSFYDTKVFVYEGVVAPGFPYDCNDDNPFCTFDGLNSLIECLPVTAFTDYYIVVDGWGGKAATSCSRSPIVRAGAGQAAIRVRFLNRRSATIRDLIPSTVGARGVGCFCRFTRTRSSAERTGGTNSLHSTLTGTHATCSKETARHGVW